MRRGVTKMAANFRLNEKQGRYLVGSCVLWVFFPLFSRSQLNRKVKGQTAQKRKKKKKKKKKIV